MRITHEAMVELIVETLQAEDGAGSDLVTGEPAGPWLDVRGNIDVSHLASDVLAATAPRQITTVEELDALPVRSVVLAHWEDGSQPDYTMMRCAEGGASSSGYGLAGTRHWLGMAKWGANLTVLWHPLP